VKTVRHWIGGVTSAGSSTRRGPVGNPATGRQQAEVLLADAADEPSDHRCVAHGADLRRGDRPTPDGMGADLHRR
jgi:hypothetical protein